MSLTEYSETGYLLSWNNGLATKWCDSDEEAHRTALNMSLTTYAVTTYQSIGHTTYGGFAPPDEVSK